MVKHERCFAICRGPRGVASVFRPYRKHSAQSGAWSFDGAQYSPVLLSWKTSRLTWHHGCNAVEGFVMTSFKTTVVHRAQFNIVLRGREHARSLTNTLYWAQNTWQSLPDCDLKGETRSSLTSTNYKFLHPSTLSQNNSDVITREIWSQKSRAIASPGSLNWFVSRVRRDPLDPPRPLKWQQE